jgi:NADPH-dependent ferric siderophore reductase
MRMKACTLKPFQRHLRRAWVAAWVCIPLWAGAAPLEAGAAWPTLMLKDQHDQPVVIDASTRLVIFTAEKSVSDVVTGVLGAQGKATLAQAHAVLVTDISAMPAMISRMFAVPKLRELPFSMALAREASAVVDLPRRKGSATVMSLENGQVTQVQYLQTEAQLRQALTPTAP